jgi:hypothetical protein
MAGNRSKCCAYSSISDFSNLKKFNVTIHPPKAPDIKEVIWHPPISLWVKCNTDGDSNNLTSSCGVSLEIAIQSLFVVLLITLVTNQLS